MDARRVLRNSVFMTGSVVGGGLMLFLIFVLVARYLSVELFGQFVFILTLASVFQLFADGGIVNITIRDIARDHDSRDRIFASTHALVWFFTLLFGAAVWLMSEVFAPSASLRNASLFMGAGALMALHGLLYAAVARAFEDMGTVAIAGMLQKLALLLLVVGAIAADTGIEGVTAAHMLANLLQWFFFARLVGKRYTRARPRVDIAHWRYLVREAVPMGVGLLLRRMTIHLGTFLLAALAGAVAVGLYNSAYRFLQMIEIGAVAVTGVLFPVFSRLFATAPDQFRRLYGNSFRFMLVLAAPVAGILVAFGDEMVLAIYGVDFREAGPVLQVLGAALLFLVPGAVMHSVFSALGKQQLFMQLSIVGVVTTGVLGLLLIPRYGSLGAAWATLATEFIVFVAGAAYLNSQKITTAYAGAYLRILLILSPLNALALWVDGVRGFGPLVLGCVVYTLAYIPLVIATKVITPAELSFVRSTALKRRPPDHSA